MIKILKSKIEKISAKYKLEPGLFLTLIISGVFFIITSGICIYRYNTLQYHDWDFALYADGMWNLVHGNPHISISNKPILGNHFTAIAFLLTPVYFILRTPITLLVLQSLSIAAVSIPIYLIARKYFGNIISSGFSAIYLAFPALLYVVLYEFHFESFAPLFLCLTFYFMIENKKLWMLLSAILAMLCKENIPAIIAAIGFYGICFRPRRRIISLFLFILGTSYFLLVTLKLQPLFTPGSGIGHASQYAKYGRGFQNIYMYMLTHPVVVIRDMFSTPLKRQFIGRILGPLLFLPIIRPDILLIIAPTLLKNLTSKVPTMHEIYWHYTGVISPFLIISIIFGLKKVKSYLIKRKILGSLITCILIVEFIAAFMFYKGSYFFTKHHYPITKTDEIKTEALNHIPKGASVMATFEFLPKLSNRYGLYTFYCIWRGGYYKKSPQIDYAIADFNNYFIRKDIYSNAPEISKLFSEFVAGNTWNAIFSKGDIVVFKKSDKQRNKLVTISKKTRSMDGKNIVTIDDSLQLMDLKYEFIPSSNDIMLIFYWHIKKPQKTLYEMYFFASNNMVDTTLTVHPVAYRYNSSSLGPGNIITEKYTLPLPNRLETGAYMISMDFVDILRRKRAEVIFNKKDYADKYGRLKIGVFKTNPRARL